MLIQLAWLSHRLCLARQENNKSRCGVCQGGNHSGDHAATARVQPSMSCWAIQTRQKQDFVLYSEYEMRGQVVGVSAFALCGA